MRKAMLIVLMLLGCLLLTGCYTDVDPWPSSGSPALQPTAAPTSTAQPADSPVPVTETSPQING